MSEIINYTFCCRRCSTEFRYTMDHDGPLPLREIHCPACDWCPLDSLGEPSPHPPPRRRRRGTLRFGGRGQ
ncbi:MAG: hypothetical protein FJZ01_22550 [Candidatus Sericytochromatia bacterium]|nr:hypothetical protein [Candidatus Tanganyikabacteria bacterium]